MGLTAADLEHIRRLLREELSLALAAQPSRVLCPPDGNEDSVDNDLDEPRNSKGQTPRQWLADVRKRAAENAARPIPDGPYLGTFDAARLVGVMPSTIVAWVKQGRLTKRR